jgi:hypothetical protein
VEVARWNRAGGTIFLSKSEPRLLFWNALPKNHQANLKTVLDGWSSRLTRLCLKSTFSGGKAVPTTFEAKPIDDDYAFACRALSISI